MALLALYWGMLVGCYIIAAKLRERSGEFGFIGPATLFVIYLLVLMMGLRMGINDQVIGICILLGLVGFDLGLSGNIAANIKSVGMKVIAFPIAAVLGSLLFGSVCGIFFGFSLREGVAISAGFGWYTYAPAVIAGAGAQYTVASAVSFMHNMMREVAGIVLIPVLAKNHNIISRTAGHGIITHP